MNVKQGKIIMLQTHPPMTFRLSIAVEDLKSLRNVSDERSSYQIKNWIYSNSSAQLQALCANIRKEENSFALKFINNLCIKRWANIIREFLTADGKLKLKFDDWFNSLVALVIAYNNPDLISNYFILVHKCSFTWSSNFHEIYLKIILNIST